ncbi:MAG: small multi-drug export protein [Candidatus Omnitrophica bacterium]|nr:small multi-drug export protein [Candidatus Omnitrophota bacterium]MCM8831005.1 small multi-drug export protein [Candidatus Omnitrophota bacterium]
MDIKNKIITFFLLFFSKEIVTILIAALPIFELRLALPLAILKFNIPLFKAILLCLFGNMLPVIPMLFFLNWFVDRLENTKIIGRFFKWWFAVAKRRSRVVQLYGFLGLIIFVAVPLPGTGAWTGCLVAKLFNFDIKKAFLAIFLGVLGATIVVSLIIKFVSFGLQFSFYL